VEVHDGVRRSRRKSPILIRYSGAGAFEAAWESLMLLRALDIDHGARPAVPLTPAVRAETSIAAHAACPLTQATRRG
jgi:hypothetical protein